MLCSESQTLTWRRRLRLVADDDGKAFPKFLDKHVLELATHVPKVVTTFVKDEEGRRVQTLPNPRRLAQNSAEISPWRW
jgi:hypothetical protein